MFQSPLKIFGRFSLRPFVPFLTIGCSISVLGLKSSSGSEWILMSIDSGSHCPSRIAVINLWKGLVIFQGLGSSGSTPSMIVEEASGSSSSDSEPDL